MKALVIGADSARARLFSWQSSDDVALDGHPEWVELETFENPEARMRDQDVFSNEKSSNGSTGAGNAHAYDDHREGHRAEVFHRFARQVAKEVSRHVEEKNIGQVILVSETEVLHELRQELRTALSRGIELRELAENIGQQTSARVHQVLASKGLLPAPPRGPVTHFVPKGQAVPGSEVRGRKPLS